MWKILIIFEGGSLRKSKIRRKLLMLFWGQPWNPISGKIYPLVMSNIAIEHGHL